MCFCKQGGEDHPSYSGKRCEDGHVALPARRTWVVFLRSGDALGQAVDMGMDLTDLLIDKILSPADEAEIEFAENWAVDGFSSH